MRAVVRTGLRLAGHVVRGAVVDHVVVVDEPEAVGIGRDQVPVKDELVGGVVEGAEKGAACVEGAAEALDVDRDARDGDVVHVRVRGARTVGRDLPGSPVTVSATVIPPIVQLVNERRATSAATGPVS